MAQIGYADFIKVLNVSNPLDWVPGLEVRTDGIWIVPPHNDDDCTPAERAVLSEHPENDLSKPALPFPCDHQQLEKFLSWLGMPLEVFIGIDKANDLRAKWEVSSNEPLTMGKLSCLKQGAIYPRQYTGRQVIERFHLLDFEIFDLLKKGLQAYTDTGKKIVDSDSLPRGRRQSLDQVEANQRAKINAGSVLGGSCRRWSEDEIKSQAKRIYNSQCLEILNPPKDCYPFSFTLPDHDKSRKEAISTALGFIFKPKDVEEYEQAQGIGPSLSPTQQTEPNRPTETTTQAGQRKSDQDNAFNFFKKNPGDYWHVGFDEDGKDVMIKHLTGLIYISYLLEKPGSAISCRELYRAASGKEAANFMSEGEAISEGLNIGSFRQPASDNKALANIRKEYDNLRVELRYAGVEEREEIEEKMEKLKPYLTTRDIHDPNDKKAQVNIKKRLDTAYDAINKTDMKNLARHLQDFIKPDGAFGLKYTGSFTWTITR